MKITCEKTSLYNAIQIVSKAVPNRTTMSILECILIEAKGTSVKFTANDMEMGIETVIEANVEIEGIIALDAKVFSEIIRKLPESDIVIESDDNYRTVISCEKSVFVIIGREGDDFSYLPKIERIDSIVISQFTLKEIIRQTSFAISEKENNKMMTGELFEIIDDKLRVCALNGHRIAIRKVDLKNSGINKKVVIPGKTLNEISKILTGETDKDVIIYFTDKHIVFEFENTVVVSRLLEGEYFRIDQMLNSDYETKIKINKKDLYNSIDRAMLLIREDDKKPVVFIIGDETVELQLNSAIGSMSDELPVDKQGKDLTIGFNPKYMLDALRVIDDEIIDIYMVNPKAPCFMKDKEETYIYVVLPVNYGVVK